MPTACVAAASPSPGSARAAERGGHRRGQRGGAEAALAGPVPSPERPGEDDVGREGRPERREQPVGPDPLARREGGQGRHGDHGGVAVVAPVDRHLLIVERLRRGAVEECGLPGVPCVLAAPDRDRPTPTAQVGGRARAAAPRLMGDRHGVDDEPGEVESVAPRASRVGTRARAKWRATRAAWAPKRRAGDGPRRRGGGWWGGCSRSAGRRAASRKPVRPPSRGPARRPGAPRRGRG